MTQVLQTFPPDLNKLVGQPFFRCFGCNQLAEYQEWATTYGYGQRHCDDCRPGYVEIQKAAKSILGRAVRDGRLKKAREFKCVDCGCDARGWDHRDYRKPLDVVPVCASCNKKRGPAKWNALHDRADERVLRAVK